MTEVIAITGGMAFMPQPGPLHLNGVPAELRDRVARVERLSGLALLAARGALDDARFATPLPRERAGVVLGTAFGCFLTNADYQQRLAAGGPAAASPRLFAATVSNAAAGEVSIALGMAGPGVTLTSGGVSGTIAVGHATNLLAAGDADVLLAGGVDAAGPALSAWVAAGGLPLEASPIDVAALLVLEPLDLARLRGARVRGTIAGHAAGFEPEPRAVDAGGGLAATIETALGRAGIGAWEIAAIAGAPASGMKGLVERALEAAFGDRAIRRLAFPGALGDSLPAGGPRAVLRALETEPPGSTVLVVNACGSGHVAVLIVEVGEHA